MDRYLSVSEIAEQLELSINTLNARIRSGNLPPPDAMIGTRYQGWKASTIRNLYPDEHGDIFDVRAAQLAPAATEVRRITEKIRSLSDILGPELGPQKADIMRKLSVLACRLEESARTHTFGVQTNVRSLASLLPPLSDDLPHAPQHSVETIDIAGLEIVPIMLPPQEITQAAALNALADLADDLEAIPQRVSSPDTGYVPASIRDETAHIAAALRSLLAQAPASAGDTDANTH
ncbi:helix-turn-helix transcriptional regulator [Mycobacterium sp. TY813]|uniref:helix-turn-helix transcriptional regulator n=1 Tax=Mycobacterium TaxID=1763 RepID=UPI0027423FF6|nr:hypothetical protein [Mycobacterium sp. TY813]MDP7732944.1 hypothetical protein [Mycobacterium sp. TY813]